MKENKQSHYDYEFGNDNPDISKLYDLDRRAILPSKIHWHQTPDGTSSNARFENAK